MVDDIGVKLRGLIKDSEYALAAHGTTTARCFVTHDGTGIVAADANAINVIGAESRGLGHSSGEAITFKSCGITPVATYETVEVGKLVKAGPGGKAVKFIDAALKNVALGDFTTITGGNFANQPANDSVDVVSDSALDITQTVTVYGWTQAGAWETESYTLAGVAEDTGAKLWARIHAVVLSAACVGNIEVHEHSGSLAVVSIAPATLSVGRTAITGGRAFCCKPDVFASGASTKYIYITGVNSAGVAAGEELQLNGATDVPTVGTYASIGYVYHGDVESARTISCRTADEEDSVNAKCGIALTGVVGAGTIYVAIK